MRDVHLRQVDLNLLSTLYALLEERHVTRAAKRCFFEPAGDEPFSRAITDTGRRAPAATVIVRAAWPPKAGNG